MQKNEVDDFTDHVLGFIRVMIALELMTLRDACERLGVPVSLLDAIDFRDLLKPEEQPQGAK